MRVLIDGDPIVYGCGFAAENNWWAVYWIEIVDGKDVEHEEWFPAAWERDDYIESHALPEEAYEIWKWVDPQPEAFALQIVKEHLENTVRAVRGFLREEDPSAEVELQVYLSGSQNFRNNVATIQGYKANRIGKPRPHWYKRIREYMIEVWHAELIEGYEADDAMAMVQWQHDEYDIQTIICTIDKDLKNVPGWHYNPIKKESYIVTHSEAQAHFYRQLLTGDNTDNIQGCYRIGPKKAEGMISPDMTEKEMYAAALRVYEQNVEKFPDKHGGLTAAESLLENARLLWMLQYPDQAWTPPGQPDESLMSLGFLDFEEEL